MPRLSEFVRALGLPEAENELPIGAVASAGGVQFEPSPELLEASAAASSARERERIVLAAIRTAKGQLSDLSGKIGELVGSLAEREVENALQPGRHAMAAAPLEDLGNLRAQQELIQLRLPALAEKLHEAQRDSLEKKHVLESTWRVWANSYASQLVEAYEREAIRAIHAAQLGAAAAAALGLPGLHLRLTGAAAGIVSECRISGGAARRIARDGWKENPKGQALMQELVSLRRQIFAGSGIA